MKEILLEKVAKKKFIKEAFLGRLRAMGRAGIGGRHPEGALTARNVLRNALIFGGAGALIGGGAAAANEIGSAITDPLKKRVGLKRMYRDNAFLNREDPKTVSKYYDTLYRFSPSMAMDPLASGSFMKKQLEFKDIGIQPTDIQTVSNIEKAVRDQQQHALMSKAFTPAAVSDAMDLG